MIQLSRRYGGRIFLSIIILAMFITSIAWTSGERKELTILESVVRDGLAPLQRSVTAVSNSVTGFFSSVWNIGTLLEDKKRLEKEVEQLQARVRELEEQEYQNLRLRQALRFQEQTKSQYSLEMATVVARDRRNWYKTLTISKGASSGVTPGMPVVTSKGLVGHVTAVSGRTATVLLVLDNRSAVGALVQINRTLGVVEGTGDQTGNLRMIHLPKDAPVRPKQVVVTSGLGGLFPKGLPIGKIEDIKIESNGLMKYALLKPFADFEHLEEVFIVKGVLPPEVPQAGKEGE
ncbi:MAG: rod shape-determining protein MreC [Firmicutes bacterium]|nr:rod shape-determining protein MreC [Bacillota bacterium]